jgi:hypothetical protein
MATVNRSFQAEAERLLHESVGHHLPIAAMISCFDTLIAVKSKAILVKSLMLDYPRTKPIFIEHLCECLPLLLSLKHLKLLLRTFPSMPSAISLINATFQ